LLVARLAAELVRQLALGARDLSLALLDVNRNPDRPRRIRQAPLDRLPDPEGGVGGELEPPAPIELLGRANETQDPFLDQVAERETVPLVLARDRHDQSKVRVDHSILRLHVAALDPLRELDLVRRRQQRVASRLPEEELNAVAGLEAGLGALGGRGATLVIRAAPGSRLRA